MFSSKKIENLNLWMVKIIIFAIPFIPLYISPSLLFPFVSGKNFAFRILVELAAVLWVGLIAANKEYRINNTPIVLSILSFTFIVGLADMSGINPYRSFWSNFERMEGYITILHLALYFLIMKSVFKAKKDWMTFFSIVLFVSVLVSVFPFFLTINKSTLSFQKMIVEYGTREFSTLGNPPFLASYLLLASFTGLFLTVNTQKTYVRVLCLLAIILNSAVIYLTATRGVILSAILGGIIFISLVAFRRSNLSVRKIISRTVLLLLFVCITVSVAFFIFSDTEIVKHDQTLSRFANVFSSESVKSRFEIWRMSWNAIKERPVLGWGQENIIGIYTVNPIPLVSHTSQVWIDRAHNIVIEWLISAGILGLFSYLMILGSAFYVLWQAGRKKIVSTNETVIIITTLIVYFIQNLFTFDTINTYIILFALLAYIDNIALDEKQEYSGSKNNIDLSKLKIVSISATLVALLCFSLVFYHVNYKPIRQSRHFIKMSVSSQEDESFLMLLRNFNSALSLNTFGNSEVINSMFYVSYDTLRLQQFDKEGALKFIQATVDKLKNEIASRSYDLEFMTSVTRLLYKIAEYDRSFIPLTEALIRKCILINPEYQWLYMALADVNVLSNDYESAYANVKQIAALNPENESSQFKLVLMALYSSREEIAEQALGNIKRVRNHKYKRKMSQRKSFLALAEHHQLAQFYRDVKRYDVALQHLKEFIDSVNVEPMAFNQDGVYYNSQGKEKKIAQIHVEMAEMYLMQNDRINALKETGKAVKIDPDLSEDATTLIDSINSRI